MSDSSESSLVFPPFVSILILTGSLRDPLENVLRNKKDPMARRQIKYNKKIHLVRWEIIHTPLIHGGLIIRDPSLMNLTIGVEIVQCLLT